MKKIILTIFLISSLFVSAQETESKNDWAPLGAEWFYSSTMTIYDFSKYTSERDTIIEEKQCTVITNEGEITEIMYQENGKVYYRFNEKFNLIYDFSADIGDKISFVFKGLSSANTISTYQIDYIVTHIENSVINGASSRIFHTSKTAFEDTENLDYDIWSTAPASYTYRERIGKESGCLYGILPFIAVCTGDIALRCYHDCCIDYTASWWLDKEKPCDYATLSAEKVQIRDFNIYPNPVKHEFEIRGDMIFTNSDISIEILDLSGSRHHVSQLNTHNSKINVRDLKSGIYILKISDESGSNYYTKIIKL